MRTRIIFTTLLLFIGLGLYAQKDNNSSESNSNERESSDKPESSNFSDATDDYKGKTKLINVTPNILFLQGEDENMGIYLGKDGVSVIDVHNEEEMSRNVRIINRLSKKKPINYLYNTSGKVKYYKPCSDLQKKGTVIVSSQPNYGDDKKNKLKGSTSQISNITYTNEITFNHGSDQIKLFSINNSGNSIVKFTKSNVLFTGDIFYGRKYLLIDSENGNSIDDISAALSKIKSKADNETKIIPGKGSISNLTDVINTMKMLNLVYKQIHTHRSNGKSLEQVLALNITRNYDSQGYGNGLITSEMFVTSIYNDIANELGAIDTRTPEEKGMDRLKEIQKEKENKN